MSEFYLAKQDAADFFDLSCPVAIGAPELRLGVIGDARWKPYALVPAKNGALGLCRDPRAPNWDWEPLSYFGSNVLAIAVKPGSSLEAALKSGDFAPLTLPPVIAAADTLAAAAGLFGIALDEMRKSARLAVDAQSALAETRLEIERTQEAMAAALRTLGGLPLGEAQIAWSSLPAQVGPTYRLPKGATRLRQRLALPLDGLTAIALHIAATQGSAASALSIRLRGADSQIIHGSWHIPADKLTPSWLTLDLRHVLGPLFETAVLDIEATLVGDDRIELSLDPKDCEDYVALTGDDALPARSGACVRLFRAAYGARNILPRFWNWDEINSGGVEGQLSGHIAPECWSRVETVFGDATFVSIGAQPSRPVANLAPGEPARFRIDDIVAPHTDALEFMFTMSPPARAPLRVQTWIESRDAEGLATGAWASGWKVLPIDCERAYVAMRIPEGVGCLNLVVDLETSDREIAVEWTGVAGIKLDDEDAEQLAQMPGGSQEVAKVDEAPAPHDSAAASRTGPLFSGIQIDHVLVIPDADYKHIDLNIFDLRVENACIPVVRTKLVRRGEGLMLEFRNRADWPKFFERWPEGAKDQFGPLFLLQPSPASLERFKSLTTPQDFKLMSALFSALPRVVVAALNDPQAAGENHDEWTANTARFLKDLGFYP
ncbi:MAG: DUF6212 domain-containing protein [Alphaproteobacteria bacterium]|nr:DUF6212 domain-containing protein [Alphaproteobacteria bacterium]